MNDETSSAPETPRRALKMERNLSYYAVLYLDLMGQHDAVVELEDLTVLGDNQPEYYRRFGEAAGKVWGVRGALAYRLNQEMSGARASAGYPLPKVSLQMFSDTVMVYFPWDRENPNAFIALYSLLAASAEIMIRALADSIPIRGGLDVHLATEFNESKQENPANMISGGGDIWGPAPKRAFELSEKDHNYMRIRVGDDVLSFIKKSAEHIGNELQIDPYKARWFQPCIAHAKKMAGMIAKDPVDNQAIIDYLGNGMGTVLSTKVKTLIGNVVTFAESAYNDPQSSSNFDHGVVDKYEKLLTYIRARQQPNGIVPVLDAR